jgi:threonine dehydrogenase-like Zn-dependent dehydrogenase
MNLPSSCPARTRRGSRVTDDPSSGRAASVPRPETGVVGLIRQAMETISPGGIVCLTGVGSPAAPATASVAALATDVVLKNIVLFGSVNANRRHYYRAAKVLAAADRSWLEQLVTRRVRPEQAEQALQRAPDDIKVVMEFAQP